MRLVQPSLEWEKEHRTYIEEWGPSRLVPSCLNIEGYSTYNEFLDELEKRKKGVGKWLPFSCYFLVDENNRIIGMLDIRHELNDFLYRIGGNIGYSVRPTERKKGYATLTLKLGLEKCKDIGMKEVLITCDQDNVGSAKVILNNGGVEDRSMTDSDGTVKRRFWINL